MDREIKAPAGLRVHQVRQVPPEGLSVLMPGVEPAAGPDSGMVALEETLTYLLPGRLRSEINRPGSRRICVVSDEGTVTVVDGALVSRTRSPWEGYVDVLLYRDHDSLARKMAAVGIEVAKVTFQRLDGRICYFIGRSPADGRDHPGLWIDKETFFPVRYRVRIGDRMVDVRYENWQKVSKTWYPMGTRIFVDGRLFADIKVTDIELAPEASPAMFDVNGW